MTTGNVSSDRTPDQLGKVPTGPAPGATPTLLDGRSKDAVHWCDLPTDPDTDVPNPYRRLSAYVCPARGDQPYEEWHICGQRFIFRSSYEDHWLTEHADDEARAARAARHEELYGPTAVGTLGDIRQRHTHGDKTIYVWSDARQACLASGGYIAGPQPILVQSPLRWEPLEVSRFCNHPDCLAANVTCVTIRTPRKDRRRAQG